MTAEELYENGGIMTFDEVFVGQMIPYELRALSCPNLSNFGLIEYYLSFHEDEGDYSTELDLSNTFKTTKEAHEHLMSELREFRDRINQELKEI